MSLKEAFARSLKALAERLEAESPASVRGASRRWYQKEIPLPPGLVAGLSAALIALVAGSGGPLLSAAWARIALVLFLCGLFIAYVRYDFPEIAKDDDGVALLSFLFLTTLLLSRLVLEWHRTEPAVSALLAPAALAGLLAALLLSGRLAGALGACVSLTWGLVGEPSLERAWIAFLGSGAAIWSGLKVRTRSDVTRAGFAIAAAQSGGVVLWSIAAGTPAQEWLGRAGWAAGSGVLASLIALGLLPTLESFFSHLSPIRLLELSDLNHPLLRRLSLEAPGTYHHSLVMANLADAAASAIGANNLLARVGAYFHDIGKLVKPEFFVENQEAGQNPHDEVSPSMSRLVIMSHVKEGLALASLYRVNRRIADFIPMHHGTSRVDYFYHKAVAQAELADPDEPRDTGAAADPSYRYSGPKPDSRETAIVMLADSVEAAARALEEPNHQRFQDTVYRIVNRRLFDGQLDGAPLTLRDLRRITDTFVTTLMGIYHARIKYPSSPDLPGGLLPEARPSPPQNREP